MSNQPSDHRKLRPSKPAARERAVAPAGLKHIADKYSIIFDTTSDGIWIHNLDGQILEVNDAYCRMSGYTRDELLKLRIPDIEAVAKPEDVARHIRRVAETGFDRFESKHRKKNGEVFDVEISASYWRATGQFLLFARDISRRKRGEAELAQHRDHLDEMVKQRTTLLERMNTQLEDEIAERKRAEAEIESLARFPSENPYPVLRLSRDGTILYANPPGQALLGGQGSASGEATPAFLRAMAREAFGRRAATPVDIELDEKWWSFVVTPVVDAGYANFYGRDITDRKRAEEALRENEENARRHAEELAALMDLTPTAVWVSDDPECRVIRGNSAAQRFYEAGEGDNLSAGAIGGVQDTTRRFFQDGRELKPEELPMQVAAATGQGVVDAEMDVLLPSGSTITILGNASPLLDAEGEVRGSIAAFVDITQRKQAEEALRQSEERYRALVDSAPDAIIVHREGDLLYANPAALDLYGAGSFEQFASHDIMKLVVPEDAKTAAERVRVLMAGQKVPLRQGFIVRLDGQAVPIEVISSPIEYEGGRAAQAIIRNITERKRAEEQLRQLGISRAMLATTVAQSPLGVALFTPDGKYAAINKTLAQMNGIPAEDHIGRTVAELLPDLWPQAEPIFKRIIEHGEENVQVVLEGETPAVSGERRSWLETWYPVKDDDGALLGIGTFVEEVTQKRRAEEEMRLQSTALQAAANGIVITDREGTIRWVNQAFERLTGYSAAEAIGNNLRVLKSGRHDEAFYRTLWTNILSGRVWHGEIVNKRKDGRFYTEEMTITPVVTAGGEITNFIAIKQDITERKQAEEALRQANERIEKLLGANVIGIAEFDATKIVSANRALLDMTGYSERDVARGRIDWREITPPEYAERDNRAWREMMERGECLPYEKEYLTRDGRRIPILIAGVRLTEDPVTGVFLNLDITDWKLMERELLETTHYAEHLFESSLIGLTRSNSEGLLDANDAFLDMVGYTRADLGAGLIDIQAMTPPEYAALDERAMREMLTTDEAAPYEREYIRKDGSRVPVLIGRKLLKESPPEWVAFVLDATERKRAQADLERVRTEFLGEISHELKTPLTAIKGCASIALSSVTPPDPAEARELFEVVDAQANRLTDLVGNLLDMTRIEGGRLSIEPEEIALAKIVGEAGVIFEHSRYPHSLQVKLPPKLPSVRADGRRIVQVLANLYSNAAKFSSPQTPIVVSAEHRGSEVVVHVRDRGAGIPGDKMPLLFQKFVQIHTIGAKGTGLGLFICKGIVEAQGGRIWAESAGEGQGSTFSFALPAVAARRTAATKGAKTGTGKPAPGVGGRGQRRVVAIDDEPHILRYLEHCLRTANYEVAMTTDPFAAPALVKSQDPDIVLLDMRLPGTSGLRVLEEIRKFSSVPVAFITATANREDVERGRQFGGATWLEKPFSREQLLGHVRATLAQHRRRKR